MICLCPSCGQPANWELQRVGPMAMLMVKCFACDPNGPWLHEPVELIRKPAGKADLWPAPTDAPVLPQQP